MDGLVVGRIVIITPTLRGDIQIKENPEGIKFE
jgi:hypothetical protein